MELEEKIAYFKEEVHAAASQNVQDQVDQYQAVLQKDFDQAIAESRNMFAERLINEQVSIRKENNKKLSQAQIKQQRELYIREEELKQKLFQEFDRAIENYKQTEEYISQLKMMMHNIINYADQPDQVELYIDQSNANLLADLQQETGYDIRVSDRPFVGGVRGVLRNRNILIDYSFKTLLTTEREEFTIEGVCQPNDNGK